MKFYLPNTLFSETTTLFLQTGIELWLYEHCCFFKICLTLHFECPFLFIWHHFVPQIMVLFNKMQMVFILIILKCESFLAGVKLWLLDFIILCGL